MEDQKVTCLDPLRERLPYTLASFAQASGRVYVVEVGANRYIQRDVAVRTNVHDPVLILAVTCPIIVLVDCALQYVWSRAALLDRLD